jgi:crossover junction endodeoxyribonuclease RuvC
MLILGIDPGLRITGYGVVRWKALKPLLVDAGVIRLGERQSIPRRLVELESELDSILDEHRPDICAVEQLYAHYGHPRTAILMGHARGVILLAAARRQVRVVELSANRVKQSVTGNGHASKEQMQRAIQSLWKLGIAPQPPDVADALAVALCCGRELSLKRLGSPARR